MPCLSVMTNIQRDAEVGPAFFESFRYKRSHIGSCSYGTGIQNVRKSHPDKFFCYLPRGVITLKSIQSTLAITALIAGLILTQNGCTKSDQEAVADNPAMNSPVPAGMVRGTVLETMDAGGYTYVFIETDHDKHWMATQQTAVQVGDTVQAPQGMPMANFESKSLNRTFDVVYFLSGLENLSAPDLAESQPGIALPESHPSIGNAVETPAADISVIELEAGQNIAYVYANKDALANQQVSLRGKVVKYNAGILGWNFIHIQDGTGDAADGSNDLTVTSKATTAMGETIVVTGTILLDKDFGAGYRFPLLMEDANIAVE